MDAQAATLLATLKRPALTSEAKLTALNALKSDIKHCRVPENAQATIYECIKLAITQQASSSISAAGFSTFGHLIKRLKIQDPSGATISHLSPRLFAAITERLGDLREPTRTSASNALTDLWPFLGEDVERIVREDALAGTNVRAREAGMQWVVHMHRDENMPFKSFVSPIVANLEDADGTAREAAKNALIELFKDAPDRAKIDLKRQLKAHSVRHSIESQILAQIGSDSAPRHEEHEPATRSQDHANLADSISQPPPVETVQMDPINVYSEREVNDMFRDMLPHFEGKETEHNWMLRDKSVLKLRRVLQGNAPEAYHHAFMAGVKSMVEGTLKVANSLRTTMSTNGCQFVQELARTLGPAMDPHVEILLQAFIKMSSNTKHIAAENGKITSDSIFQHCTYNVRMMQHIWSAVQEKNAQIRQCTPQWLRTILRRQSSYKTHFESTGGLDLAEKSIRKGLDDANPKVKEAMRATYWTFAKTWPEKADQIMNKLDPKSRTMLEKDSNNPNAGLFQSTTSAAPSRARTPATAGRSALKEMMAEQRRAKSAGRNTERPNSAMAAVSPTKRHDRAPSRLRENRVASNTSTTSTLTTASKGGALMSGPVRRPRKPEIQRPLTADPYASRRMVRPETPSNAALGTSQMKASIGSKSSIPSPTSTRSHMRHARHDSTEAGSPSSRKVDGQERRDEPRSALRTPQGLPRPQSIDVTRSFHSQSPSGNHHDVADVVRDSEAESPDMLRSPLKAMIEAAREKLDRPTSSSSDRHIARLGDPFEASDSPILRPVKSSAGQDVQVYEDADPDDAEGQVAASQQVLSELPINENVRMLSPAQSNGSSNSADHPTPRPETVHASQTPGSPRERSESMRNRRLLISGIERIRSRTLDAHGFRRLQDLTKSATEIWDDQQKFDELASELLAYLLAFDKDSNLVNISSTKAAGLKAQALSVLRALVNVHQKMFRPWFERALATVLQCRAQTSDSSHSHLVADLERTADDVLRLAPSESAFVAITAYLTQTSEQCPSGKGVVKSISASIAMALMYLRALIASPKMRDRGFDDEQRSSLVSIASKYLEHEDAEVRKADVELACAVHSLFHGASQKQNPEFWDHFQGIEEGRLGLLTYYIARNRGDSQVS